LSWQRPVPVIGDTSSAAERSAAPDAWRLPEASRRAVYEVIDARRDIRRFRPDPVDDAIVERILTAAHHAPSVGQSQPWRFVVVSDDQARQRAAWMADRERLAQAAQLDETAARHLLDLQLEGIREAPLGVVVCCDRRAPAAGVLGRATFPDADLWSCACAIQNLWLAARAEGLGVGWVTLFLPAELAELLALPAGVVPLGWLCLGWPDERPPEPGLQRAGWSKRQPLSEVVIRDRWPGPDAAAGSSGPRPPVSKVRSPGPPQVVAARDQADDLLTPLGSLGVLDRAVDRIMALGRGVPDAGTLILAGGRHPVVELGVSAFAPSVTDEVLAAARTGEALGAVAAGAAGLGVEVIDAGSSTGNLRDADALDRERVDELVEVGRRRGRAAAGSVGLVALGEVGVGNTVVAAALAAALLGLDAADTVGLGAGSDTAMLERRRAVVDGALRRVGAAGGVGTAVGVGAGGGVGAAGGVGAVGGAGAAGRAPLLSTVAALGGPEFAVLAGVTLGAAEGGAAVVLDGLATSVAALVAALLEPGVVAHLIAGQRSRERAHPAVLGRLGLEPLLDLRMRAGEGAGAALAAGLVLDGCRIRQRTARTRVSPPSEAFRSGRWGRRRRSPGG
jgi:nicotinate-nucleotide--dimethylbenzimidazole phosphoribosyltransferase